MGGIICLWIRTWLLLLALVFLLSANYVLSVKEMSRKWQRIKNTFLTTDVGAKRLSYPDIPLEECLIEKCMLGKLDLTCTAVNYNTKTNECVLPILDGYTSGLNYMELDDWTYWEWEVTFRSCDEHKADGKNVSGNYVIDPDGPLYGVPPFQIYCDMRFSNPVAIVNHNHETLETKHNSEQLRIIYKISVDLVTALMSTSQHCHQYLKKICRKSYGIGENHQWMSRDGIYQSYWAGGSNEHRCACLKHNECQASDFEISDTICEAHTSSFGCWSGADLTITRVGYGRNGRSTCANRHTKIDDESCMSYHGRYKNAVQGACVGYKCSNIKPRNVFGDLSDPCKGDTYKYMEYTFKCSGTSCNCDASEEEDRIDDGFITDRSLLPVIKLKHSKLPGNGQGKQKLGPLRCSNADIEYPQSCDDYLTLGYVEDTKYELWDVDRHVPRIFDYTECANSLRPPL